MLAIVGFAVGYVVGCRAGQEGLSQLMKAWETIQKSDEFAAMMETGKGLVVQAARQAFETGGGVLAGEVKGAVGRLRVA
ncbi:MAG: hypothetical protein ACRD0C_15080 [Acidimicrobiia bacterium]